MLFLINILLFKRGSYAVADFYNSSAVIHSNIQRLYYGPFGKIISSTPREIVIISTVLGVVTIPLSFYLAGLIQ